MRGKRLPLLLIAFALTVLLAGALTGCGETALEKASQNIAANEALTGDCIVGYDSEQDILSVAVIEDCDLEALFTTLNESIQDQEIGGLYFTDEAYVNAYHHYLDDNLRDTYSEKIGGLSCSSLGTLALGGQVARESSGAWTAIASKAGKVWIPSVWDANGYEGEAAEGLKNIRVLWTLSNECGGACIYPNLEELAVCEELELNIEPQEGAEADATAEAEQTEATEATEETEAAEQAEEAEAPSNLYEMEFDYDDSYNGFRQLKKAKSLQRILIAPSRPGWKMNQGTAGYIFGICNFRPEIMMNPPEKPYSEDSLVRADSIDVSLIDEPAVNSIGIEMEDTLRTVLLKGFLEDEIQPCYKKCAKYKESSKSPKINGKALVYIVDPYQYSENDWADKREYNSDGKLLLTEIADDIPVPELAGDYDTFIYGYPTFTKVGTYTSGTKAYSQTYHVQVFDRKKKIAYEAQTVGTEQPENKFSYSGSAPDKHSGIVPEKKIISFIKKLK